MICIDKLKTNKNSETHGRAERWLSLWYLWNYLEYITGDFFFSVVVLQFTPFQNCWFTFRFEADHQKTYQFFRSFLEAVAIYYIFNGLCPSKGTSRIGYSCFKHFKDAQKVMISKKITVELPLIGGWVNEKLRHGKLSSHRTEIWKEKSMAAPGRLLNILPSPYWMDCSAATSTPMYFCSVEMKVAYSYFCPAGGFQMYIGNW